MKKIAILGKAIVEQTNFAFGSYRYIVERSNVNTTIYKFDDYWKEIWIGINNQILSDDEVKQSIIDCSIDFIKQDSDKFENYFISEEESKSYFFFERALNKRKFVNHGYKECKDPYDKCPHCGGDIQSLVEDPTNAVDCFNYCEGFNGEYSSASWDEVYECPHCGKRFYIEGES